MSGELAEKQADRQEASAQSGAAECAANVEKRRLHPSDPDVPCLQPEAKIM